MSLSSISAVRTPVYYIGSYVFAGGVVCNEVGKNLFRIPIEERRKIFIHQHGPFKNIPASRSKSRNAYSVAWLLLLGALPVFLLLSRDLSMTRTP